MPTPTPTTEPSTIAAGDTVIWTKTVSDYPASQGYTLHYNFQNRDYEYGPFDATPSGDNYSVSLTPAQTALLAPGTYDLVGYVTKGSDRYTVSQTSCEITADETAARPSTHASRTLALIELAIENRMPRGLENYSMHGQVIAKMPVRTLVELRSYYKDLVKNEIAQDRIDRGLGNPRNSFARFRRVGGSRTPPFSPPYA